MHLLHRLQPAEAPTTAEAPAAAAHATAGLERLQGSKRHVRPHRRSQGAWPVHS